MDGIDFTINEKALKYIVGKAVEYRLGARGLRSLCEEILTAAFFEIHRINKKTYHHKHLLKSLVYISRSLMLL